MYTVYSHLFSIDLSSLLAGHLVGFLGLIKGKRDDFSMLESHDKRLGLFDVLNITRSHEYQIIF